MTREEFKEFEARVEQAKSQIAREKMIKTIEKWLNDEAKGKFKLTHSELIALIDAQRLLNSFIR